MRSDQVRYQLGHTGAFLWAVFAGQFFEALLHDADGYSFGVVVTSTALCLFLGLAIYLLILPPEPRP